MTSSLTLTQLLLLIPRTMAGAWALLISTGSIQVLTGIARLHPFQTRDDALIFPWLAMPLAASAGLAAGFAIWGFTRPDRIGSLTQLAMALWASIIIPSIAVDIRTNPRPTDHALGAGVFTMAMLALVIIASIHHALVGPWRPWQRILRMLLAFVPSVFSVVVACLSVSGWMRIVTYRNHGWGIFEIPVMALVSIITGAIALALVWLAWRICLGPEIQNLGRPTSRPSRQGS